MKYLKSYKLFESLNNTHFPTEEEVSDFFIELQDDNILHQPIKNFKTGYIFFPHEPFGDELSDQFVDAIKRFPDDWTSLRPDILHGDSWSELFLDVNDRRNHYSMDRCIDWVWTQQSTINEFTKLIWKNIENGKIKAYPSMSFYLAYFEKQYYPNVIECLQRLYDATDFRPVGEVWEEGLFDEETGDVVELYGMDLTLYNEIGRAHV